jgi:hypothetical protein
MWSERLSSNRGTELAKEHRGRLKNSKKEKDKGRLNDGMWVR